MLQPSLNGGLYRHICFAFSASATAKRAALSKQLLHGGGKLAVWILLYVSHNLTASRKGMGTLFCNTKRPFSIKVFSTLLIIFVIIHL
jgi:hypothetical protein